MALSTEETVMESTPAVASFGFWANKSIPLSAGVRKVSLPISAVPPQVVDPQVKSMCHVAQELAEAGADIRWDIILEQAANLPCGIRTCNVAKPDVPMKKQSFDSEDCESTSAGSGTVSDAAAANDTDTTKGSEEEFPLLGSIAKGKSKKKRGAGIPSTKGHVDTPNKKAEDGNSGNAPDVAPTRTDSHGSTASLVYTLPFLLQVFQLMREAESKEARCSSPGSEKQGQACNTEIGDGVDAKCVSAASTSDLTVSANHRSTQGASSEETNLTAKKNAPWRRTKAAVAA